ncbi:hypothetical protein Tco_0272727 [Tanacetum coccineum]
MADREEKKRKRYKSSSNINTKESGECSFNLNTMAGDEEDEVEEVCRSRPIGTNQAKRKRKAETSSTSSISVDVEALANEYLMASETI